LRPGDVDADGIAERHFSLNCELRRRDGGGTVS
jgi:hypothetical protein